MKRALAVVAALIALAAVGWGGGGNNGQRGCGLCGGGGSNDGGGGGGSDAGLIAPDFLFASPLAWASVDGGTGIPQYAGLPMSSTLCSQLTAAEIGTGFCLNGDGTNDASNLLTMTVAGTAMTATNLPVCPGGPFCTAVALQRFNAVNNKYESGNTTSPTDFSGCAVVSPFNFDQAQYLLSRQGNAGNKVASLYIDTAGKVVASVYKDQVGGVTTVTSAGALTARAHHVICLDFDSISDGASVLKVYIDGVNDGASAVAVSPPQADTIPWAVGYNQFAADLYLKSLHRGSFMVASFLGAARMLSIANAVLGLPITGTKSEPQTFARTTAIGCPNSYRSDAGNQYYTTLPPHRPCITDAALGMFGTYTNTEIKTEEFDDVAWSNNIFGGLAGVVVTPNVASAPDGTLSGDKLSWPACPLLNTTSARQAAQVTMPGTNQTVSSLYVKSTDGGSSDFVLFGFVDFALGGPTGYLQKCPLLADWTRCQIHVLETGNPVSPGFQMIGCLNEALYLNHQDVGAGEAFVWGNNMTGTSSIRPYARANTVQVQIQPESNSFGYDSTPQTTVGSTSVTTYYQFGSDAGNAAKSTWIATKDIFGVVMAQGDGTGSFIDQPAQSDNVGPHSQRMGTTGWERGDTVRHAARWDGGSSEIANRTSGVSQVMNFGYWAIEPTALYVGSAPSSGALDAYIFNVCLDRTLAGCY